MTMPGQGVPDNPSDNEYGAVLVKGSNFSQDLVDKDMEEIVMGSDVDLFSSLAEDWQTYFANILNEVWESIQEALQALGHVGADVITGLIDGFTELVEAFGAVISGDVSKFEEESPLADLADGQRQLIDGPDQLEKNAGFCNLTMSINQSVEEENEYHYLFFDTYVTQHKNARLGQGTWRLGDNSSAGNYNVMWFDGPGVWNLDLQATLEPKTSSVKYHEFDLVVFKSPDGTDDNGLHLEQYSMSRIPQTTNMNKIQGYTLHKPVVIPDDGHLYCAVVRVRFDEYIVSRRMWGGTVWSSFAANRMSTDATEFDPPSEVSND